MVKLLVKINGLIGLYLLLFFVSCSSVENEKKVAVAVNQPKQIAVIKYAERFSIEEYETYKILTVKGAWKGDENIYQYVLYKSEKPAIAINASYIKVPIQKIACSSLTHIAFIETLEKVNSIVALSGCNFVNSEKVKSRIKSGHIKEIGQYHSLNYEVLLDKSPDIFMVFGVNESSNQGINKLKELGITTVLNGEHMEPHPLGKAEWIKFMAAFYDMGTTAETYFNKIEESYLSLAQLTRDIEGRPSVFVGLPFKGDWYAPEGGTFVAKLFQDAGAHYIWGKNTNKGSVVKSKEVVLDVAYSTDFWLNLSNVNSLQEVVAIDEKFTHFEAYKNKQLFNNNKRLNALGGNDYWESGVINPDLILKDLIEIFHPSMLNHDLYYYHQLE